jgi:hypothetical protein
MRTMTGMPMRVGQMLLLVCLLAGAPALATAGIMTDTPVFAVTHAATDTSLVTAGSNGHRLGDMRVVSLAIRDAAGATGRLDSVLVTTAIDSPSPGDEVRIGQLVFTFADAADQIYVAGAAVYPAMGSTIKVASSVVRPILGGSGKYAGASGWCESEHLPDGSWRHTFHLAGATTPR